MIEIIKEGNIKHQCKCIECGCVFKYDAEDVTRVTVWEDHGGHYPVCDGFYIYCPCCKIKINLIGVEFNDKEKEVMEHIDD